MGWLVKHIQDHPGGRKSFRRQYPPHLRPYLSGTQLRVSLGRPDSPDFLSRYQAADQQWRTTVEAAERRHAGELDLLTPDLISFLVGTWKEEQLALDEEVRWTPRPAERKKLAHDRLRANIMADMEEAISLRAIGDIGTISVHWAEAARMHAENEGYVLDTKRPEFLTYVRTFQDAQIEAWQLILQRTNGADVPTPPPPPRPQGKSSSGQASAALPLLKTFDAYASAQGISDNIRGEWRRNLQNLVAFVGHDDAQRLQRDDVERWRDALLAEKTQRGTLRHPSTVKGNYLAPLRLTLTWAVEEKRLGRNVAADVLVRVPKAPKLRDKDFTMAEATSILKASLEAPKKGLSPHYKLALRWIPWLCAYTGARVNEFSQFRKEDLKEVDGVWIMNITPEAGTVKTGMARQVPVHAHLIQQGFLAMVESQPDGPIFYDPSSRKASSGNANRLFKKVGEKVAKWVREDVGITDKAIKPNHAWRHLFKTLCADAEIDERVADAIQGHAPKTVGGTYGKVSIKARAAAMEKFPWFQLD